MLTKYKNKWTRIEENYLVEYKRVEKLVEYNAVGWDEKNLNIDQIDLFVEEEEELRKSGD